MLDLLPVGNLRLAVRVDDLRYTTVDENGSPAKPNPQYKQPTANQPPMAVRLGMQVDF